MAAHTVRDKRRRNDCAGAFCQHRAQLLGKGCAGKDGAKTARETCARQSYLLRGRSALWLAWGLKAHTSIFLLGVGGLGHRRLYPSIFFFGRAEQGQKAARQLPAREHLLWARQLMCRGPLGPFRLTKSFAEQSNDLPSIRLVAEHKVGACRAQGLVAEHGGLRAKEKDLLTGGLDDQKVSLGSL